MIKSAKGFTLVELLVVVAIIALLVSLLLPVLIRVEQHTKRALCMANLKSIGFGWTIYTGANGGNPPILSNTTSYRAYKTALRMGDECTDADLGAGAQQCLNLLVKNETVTWDIFLCPSTSSMKANRSGAGREYGLGEGDKSYCDYGVQISDFYGANMCPLSKKMDGDMVIVGDKGPWLHPLEDPKIRWSPNHPNSGENLMTVAGNVRFSKDKAADDDRNTGGLCGNNVYTRDNWDNTDPDSPTLNFNGCTSGSSGSYVGYPASSKDTVLWAW